MNSSSVVEGFMKRLPPEQNLDSFNELFLSRRRIFIKEFFVTEVGFMK